MPQYKEIEVPDIGDFQDVPVIEILVKEGERVEVETPLVTLESDKATLDVPSPFAGKVQNVVVAEGDLVSQGTPLITLAVDTDETPGANSQQAVAEDDIAEITDQLESTIQQIQVDDDGILAANDKSTASEREPTEVSVPDIGDYDDVEIIEVHVAAGDSVEAEDPLITLESDKATMDIPAPTSGEVVEVRVNLGDRVSKGNTICYIRTAAESTTTTSTTATSESISESMEDQPVGSKPSKPKPAQKLIKQPPKPPLAAQPHPPPSGLPEPTSDSEKPLPHASPSIRRFARELGVDLYKVTGTGTKARILKEDVQQWVKRELSEPKKPREVTPVPGAFSLPEMPVIDFSQFGDIETQPLGRIKKLTSANLHRSWLHVPHVTQHDEADITELEAFRQDLKKEQEKKGGARITLLSFLMKACVVGLKRFPQFNASLENGGENLILKQYYNIGIAVETEGGLVVPVVPNVDQKSVTDLAEELSDISSRARVKKLSPKDLQGASFTISSLGGIGGTAFTPIINAPEVAILGVSRSSMKPVYVDKEFVPRLIIPLSLSYDHRVIDGAEAARFTSFLATVLADVRRLLL